MNRDSIDIRYLSTKAQSKHEIYRLLTVEVNLYLPPEKECSIYFIRDILQSKKRAIYNEDVKVTSVPQIDNLRVKDLIKFIEEKCDNGPDYLQNDYWEKSLNRQWLCNLCNTLNEDEFKLLVKEALEEREAEFVKNQNLEISADPRIVKAIERSSMISTIKGRSHLLIRERKNKVSRRSDNINLNLEESKESNDSNEVNKLKDEIMRLNKELDLKDSSIKNESKYADLLNDLFKSGIIDSEGKIINDSNS